jgi:hypothetical protein
MIRQEMEFKSYVGYQFLSQTKIWYPLNDTKYEIDLKRDLIYPQLTIYRTELKSQTD